MDRTHPRARLVVAMTLCALGAVAVVVAITLSPVATRTARAAVPVRGVVTRCFAASCGRDVAVSAVGGSGIDAAAAQGVAELADLHGDSDSKVVWDPHTGLWGAHVAAGKVAPGWWQSALSTWTVARYLLAVRSRDPRYQHVIDGIYSLNVSKPGTHMAHEFENQFLDDTGWWGLAWETAARYEAVVRHDRARFARYLAVARADARYIAHAPTRCGGGVAWRLGWPPDTIASAELIALDAKLYADTGDGRWVSDAASTLYWLETSGLINVGMGIVRDHLDWRCRVSGGSLTYTEGMVADALVSLGVAVHEPSYLGEAERFLRYTVSARSGMSRAGVLQEACEAFGSRCRGPHSFDVASFKGIFMVAPGDYGRATGSSEFGAFLRSTARAVLARAATDGHGSRTACETAHRCQLGFDWSRPADPKSAPVKVTFATQQSALGALIAAL